MNRKIHTFKKSHILISIFIGLLLFIHASYYNDNNGSILIYIVSTMALVFGVAKWILFRYKIKQVIDRHKLHSADESYLKKRAEVLLEVGNICSWQYSIAAGILRFDTPNTTLLHSNKIYYTYEELSRNRHIRSIIDRVIEKGNSSFDDEIYIPGLKKWFIIRGRMMDMFDTLSHSQYVGVIIDNTERRETLKRLELLSTTDELTGVKNRRSFFEQLRIELNLYKRDQINFSVAMIDLDNFKTINDSFGHQAGDNVLKDFTTIINKNIRPYDTVFRIGGEEFVIIFGNSNQLSAVTVLERIKEELMSHRARYNGLEISYTFSCGVGEAKELNLYTEKELITIIDTRLYKAKESGRNLVISGG